MTTTEQGVWVGGRRTSDATTLVPSLSTARAFPGGFVWLALHDAPEGQVRDLARQLDLPPLAVDDVLNAHHQRPKLELYGDTVFVVLKRVRYDDAAERVRVAETAVFLVDGLVLVAEHGPGEDVPDVMADRAAAPELLALGPAAVLHGLLDRAVDDVVPVVHGLQADVDDVEESVFSPVRTNETERVYRLKRTVLELRRAVLPLRDVLARLADGSVPHVPEQLLPHFRDVHDHLVRDGERVEALERLLDGLLDATLAKVGLQENADQRTMAAWAAIALVPTVLTGLYGMNFAVLPLAGWRFGFWAWLLVAVVVCTALHRGFRRNGWL